MIAIPPASPPVTLGITFTQRSLFLRKVETSATWIGGGPSFRVFDNKPEYGSLSVAVESIPEYDSDDDTITGYQTRILHLSRSSGTSMMLTRKSSPWSFPPPLPPTESL